MKRKTAFMLVIVGVITMSFSGPLVKAALMNGASPASVAMTRMLLGALLTFPMALKKDAAGLRPMAAMLHLKKSHLIALVGGAVCLAGHYYTWMTSLNATSTFASVALVCTQPLFVAALSGLLLHEPMAKASRPGALVALVGAVLIGVSSLSTGGEKSLGGDLLALLGAALMAGHWLIARYLRRSLPAMGYTCVVYALTALALFLCLPLLGGYAMPLSALPYVVALVLTSTLLGHTLMTVALGAVSADVVSFALLGEPVGTMVWAILFFHEIPSPLLVLGGAVVLIGLVMYLRGGIEHSAQGQVASQG
ncbi:MAG: DMT family transporter [Clostridia bacterium]|nr:DMT family transporter [Clostridia bacterium]